MHFIQACFLVGPQHPAMLIPFEECLIFSTRHLANQLATFPEVGIFTTLPSYGNFSANQVLTTFIWLLPESAQTGKGRIFSTSIMPSEGLPFLSMFMIAC